MQTVRVNLAGWNLGSFSLRTRTVLNTSNATQMSVAIILRLPTNLRKVNVFSRVCLSVQWGGRSSCDSCKLVQTRNLFNWGPPTQPAPYPHRDTWGSAFSQTCSNLFTWEPEPEPATHMGTPLVQLPPPRTCSNLFIWGRLHGPTTGHVNSWGSGWLAFDWKAFFSQKSASQWTWREHRLGEVISLRQESAI